MNYFIAASARSQGRVPRADRSGDVSRAARRCVVDRRQMDVMTE